MVLVIVPSIVIFKLSFDLFKASRILAKGDWIYCRRQIGANTFK